MSGNAARLLHQQGAWRMIPGPGPAEQDEIELASRQAEIVEAGAAQGFDLLHLPAQRLRPRMQRRRAELADADDAGQVRVLVGSFGRRTPS